MITMEPQCLATLQTLLTDCGAAAIEQSLLEGFYKHCLRQPAAFHQRLASRSPKALLYHYRFLRPEIQKALKESITDHWQIFAAEVALPGVTDDPPQINPDPVFPVHEPSLIANRFASQARRDDWFDRFLDGVRILLFR
jgi:hypothetical protein